MTSFIAIMISFLFFFKTAGLLILLDELGLHDLFLID